MLRRDVSNTIIGSSKPKGQAKIARNYSAYGTDQYSDYGVGCSIVVNFGQGRNVGDVRSTGWNSNNGIYAGFNINVSGMEYKVHAEQMAIFQLMMDMAENGIPMDEESGVALGRVTVHTSENDHSLVCGHCLQVVRSFCDMVGQDPGKVEYVSVAEDSEGEFDFRSFSVDDLLSPSYVENRGVNRDGHTD